jgi:hypothetical protein
MRHLLALLAFVLLLGAGQAAAWWWRASREEPRAVWLVLRGEPGPALRQVLAQPDARLVGLWWGGRLVQLRTVGRADATVPAQWVWLQWGGPPALAGLPGCGG